MPDEIVTQTEETNVMLDKVKMALRITHIALDDEIQDVIDAALASLNAHGVATDGRTGNEPDPLILNAVKLYARWQFDYMGKASQFEKAWQAALVVMALCGDYEDEPNE